MDFERMLRYCALLEQHNDRPWFHENHGLYEEAKRDFTELTEQLKYTVAEHAGSALSERLLFVPAKNMLYRIPRDMRIYKHQPPYNPSFRAYIAPDRHAVWPVGYFYQVQPGDRSHFGTGGWCPDADWLRKVRACISENFDRFSIALADCGLPLSGEKLQRVPAGFDPGDPAGEYLKYKEWFVSASFRDAELDSFDAFAGRVAALVERMEPLRRFFDDAFAQKPRSSWDTEWA